MMRVNLLPREPETARLAGFSVDLADVRCVLAMTMVATALLLGLSGLQIWREQRLSAATVEAEHLLDLHAVERNRISALAHEVALLQRIDRESAVARHSGNDAGQTLAALGNAIPIGAWLRAIDRRSDGYLISGGARDLTTLANALDALDRARTFTRAHLASIGAADGMLTFSISLSDSRPHK